MTLLVEWWRRRRELWEDGEKGGGNQSVLINRENSFPYFIYVVAIISI